jgi:SNW domain-containing protein 1
MGKERRLHLLARERKRGVSEKLALGLAKPMRSGHSAATYDSRLFDQPSCFSGGSNEAYAYDRPLFAAHDAISSIYRPSMQQGNTKDKEQKAEPVQFEKDTDDSFQVEPMNKLARTDKAGGKQSGMQELDGPSAKRARVYDEYG